MYISKLLRPTNDYVFKRIFGYKGNEEIMKGLLNAIFDDIEIQDVKLDCKEILEKDLQSDKFGILDIRAIANNHIECDIEMQIVDKKDIEKRLLFYWSNLYSKTLKTGQDYISANRTVIILFADYKIKALESIEKYFSKWHICEDEYKSVILTKDFEIYIIELPKFEEHIGECDLNVWVKFIRNPEVIDVDDVEKNNALKKAKEVLEEISQDDYEKELAFKRGIWLTDKKAIEAAGYEKGLEKGIEQGVKQGIEQGIEQGTKDEKIKIAKKLLTQGYSREIIKEITELSDEEIDKLNN